METGNELARVPLCNGASGTLQFNEVPREWENLFVVSRVRDIEVG